MHRYPKHLTWPWRSISIQIDNNGKSNIPWHFTYDPCFFSSGNVLPEVLSYMMYIRSTHLQGSYSSSNNYYLAIYLKLLMNNSYPYCNHYMHQPACFKVAQCRKKKKEVCEYQKWVIRKIVKIHVPADDRFTQQVYTVQCTYLPSHTLLVHTSSKFSVDFPLS